MGKQSKSRRRSDALSKLARADFAEAHVSSLALQSGFTVNRVERDRAGWDQLIDIQLPDDGRSTDPLGLPLLISARIQIKSTIGSKRSVAVSLSNWRFALEEPLPWFFVVVRLDADTNIVLETAIVHFSQPLIEAVLERIYSTTAQQRENLHQLTHMLKWTDEEMIDLSLPQVFRSAICRAVTKPLHEYAAEKRDWYEKAGYGSPPITTTTFSVSAESENKLHERLSRAAVGLDKDIPISDLIVTQQRFGQEVLHPVIGKPGPANLGVLDSPSDYGWTLSVLDEHESSLLGVSVSMRFSGSIFPNLPREFWLLRLQRPFLEMLLDFGTEKTSIKLTLPPEKESFCVRDLYESLELLAAVDRGGRRKVGFQVFKGEAKSLIWMFAPNMGLNSAFRELAERLRRLLDLAASFRVDPLFKFTLRELARFDPMLHLLLSVRTNRQVPMTMESNVPDTLVSEGDEIAVITNPYIKFGSVAYVEIVMLQGPVRIPRHAGHRFRRMPVGDSTPCRSVIPPHAGR